MRHEAGGHREWRAPGTVLAVAVWGRRVRLERLAPRHLPALHRAMVAEGAHRGWPLLGERIPLPALGPYLWSLGPIHYAVVRRDTGQAIGLVQGIDEDLRSQATGVGLFVDADLWRAGWPLEGVVMFLDLLFCGYGFRKVSMIMPRSVLRRVGSATSRWLTEEYVLEDHVPDAGALDAVHVLSMHRHEWDPALARRLTGSSEPRPDTSSTSLIHTP